MMDRWLFFCKKHQFIPERSDDSITQSTARCKSHSHVTRNERPRLAENDDRLTTTGEILWGTSGNLSTLSDLVSDGQVDQML